ncbi:4-hydroxybenzoate octaprenyltransferase [Aspergillus saccharolyticus JOP 1030-1]|uniref:Putative 4-hydroxybenzoate polyprenyl transferase n=1 Tax=Aspergillus saccharolyticus JOP 1030-1 TaxID=1450539 RepID=A0A318ZC51_9EURO|nr:putative 4-hydroxybenzoate polyprenyl transferase [Aspergillus saccharolyticus JOP 1030-1]PYH44097.1 putative 4-hydroxybenzoate polyprenyl transferase [Aspergillus saccharolyticus JOP 1030-1]
MPKKQLQSTAQAEYHPPSTGIFSILPAQWVPYAELMRLDRPAGYFAFYWHYLIGMSFAAAILPPSLPLPALMEACVYQIVWVIILRGAVCTVNDNLDQKFDRQVARTRWRPIARGAVSTPQANVFALLQFAILAVMAFECPLQYATKSGAIPLYASLTTIILSVYPLGKRVTDMPQLILGVGFAAAIPFSAAMIGLDALPALPTLLDFTAWSADERVGAASLSLCIACAIWTVIFDTVYAHQDREDDIKAGVRSLAVRLGEHTKPALAAGAAIQVGLLVCTGLLSHFSAVYFVASCGGVAVALAAMLVLVDLRSSASCAWWFGKGTAILGTILLSGLVGEFVMQA